MTYRDDLLDAYEGEVAGEAFFAGLAELTAEAAEKLNLLARVERQTARVLLPLLARHGLAARDKADLDEQGRRQAAAWASSWLNLARRFAADYPRYVNAFRDMAAACPAEDRQAIGLLTDHEVAIVAFALAEAEGMPDGARHLQAYLDQATRFLAADGR